MNIEKYLNRINYSGPLEPSLPVLKQIQKQHLLTVPFENLDIHNNVPIKLSIEKFFDKIVNQNRGGFCYELNGLFYELLIALGYDAIRISARVYDENKGYGKEFDHFAIIVTINDSAYLTDVGFGEFTFGPLELQSAEIQIDERGNFLIDRFENEYFRVNKIEDGKSIPEYIFKNTKRELVDFEGMCAYHQTSPDSHFTTKRLISLPTENGRITITGSKLKIREFESIKEFDIKSETEFNEYLRTLFYK